MSKRIKPSHHAGVALPARRSDGVGARFESIQRFAFGLQIGLGIVIGGVETDVSEPRLDHSDVDASGDEMHSGRMAKAVRRDLF